MSPARLLLRAEELAPSDLLPRFCAAGDFHRFYWERPSRGEALLALGAAARLEASGAGAIPELAARSAALWAKVETTGSVPGFAPRLVGGAAFDPARLPGEGWAGFPGARLVLPDHLWHVRAGRAARFSRCDAPAPPPPRAALREDRPPALRVAARERSARWCERARRGRDAVRAGRFEKLVLARAVDVESANAFDAAALLAALRERHPGCSLFALGVGESLFLGASPEELVEVDGAGALRAAALAGSAPRGRSREEDQALARALRESKKEQEEHAIVVRALQAALEPLCAELQLPEAPELLRTDGIQHLHTPLAGRLHAPGEVGVLELVARLHPTPAVAGAPGPPARQWLRRHEELDRGWYAGVVGSAGPSGEGAFVVALRSARLRGDAATLYAGAGLVSASEPAAELAETRLKLRAILDPLLAL